MRSTRRRDRARIVDAADLGVVSRAALPSRRHQRRRRAVGGQGRAMDDARPPDRGPAHPPTGPRGAALARRLGDRRRRRRPRWRDRAARGRDDGLLRRSHPPLGRPLPHRQAGYRASGCTRSPVATTASSSPTAYPGSGRRWPRSEQPTGPTPTGRQPCCCVLPTQQGLVRATRPAARPPGASGGVDDAPSSVECQGHRARGAVAGRARLRPTLPCPGAPRAGPAGRAPRTEGPDLPRRPLALRGRRRDRRHPAHVGPRTRPRCPAPERRDALARHGAAHPQRRAAAARGRLHGPGGAGVAAARRG